MWKLSWLVAIGTVRLLLPAIVAHAQGTASTASAEPQDLADTVRLPFNPSDSLKVQDRGRLGYRSGPRLRFSQAPSLSPFVCCWSVATAHRHHYPVNLNCSEAPVLLCGRAHVLVYCCAALHPHDVVRRHCCKLCHISHPLHKHGFIGAQLPTLKYCTYLITGRHRQRSPALVSAPINSIVIINNGTPAVLTLLR